jgi:hypothetical protein
VSVTGGPICPGGGTSLVTTRGVAPVPGARGTPAGVVAVPGDGSDGVAGVVGDGGAVVGGAGVEGVGVAGCAGVMGAGAGDGVPGCAGGVAGCAGAGGWPKSSADASVTLRIAVARPTTSGRYERREVMT